MGASQPIMMTLELGYKFSFLFSVFICSALTATIMPKGDPETITIS